MIENAIFNFFLASPIDLNKFISLYSVEIVRKIFS